MGASADGEGEGGRVVKEYIQLSFIALYKHSPYSSTPLHSLSTPSHCTIFFKGDFWDFFLFYVRYSTLLHLPPLKFYCVGGCWDGTQDYIATLALTARRTKHSSTESA